MNLAELKKAVDSACERAKENREDPENIELSLQIDFAQSSSTYRESIEFHYDGNLQASGCVLAAWVG